MPEEKTAADGSNTQPSFHLFLVTVQKTVEKTFVIATADEGTGEVFAPDEFEIRNGVETGDLDFADGDDSARYRIVDTKPITKGGIIKQP